MKLKLHAMAALLLSIAGSCALVQSVEGGSLSPFTYTSRDLMLTFRKIGNGGGTIGSVYVEVDIGQASIYYGAALGSSIPITSYSATSQLVGQFDSVDNLSWSVGGCVPNAGDSGDPSKPTRTLWVTEPRQDPDVPASPPWYRSSSFTQGLPDGKIVSIPDNALTWATGNNGVPADSVTNTPTVVVIPSGSTYNASGSLGGNGDYLGYFPCGSVENTTPFDFDSAGSPSRSDLYELQPTSSGTKPPGTYLGYFELETDGTMTFFALPFPAPVLSVNTDGAGNVFVSFPSTLNGTYTLSYTNVAGLSAPTSTWPTVSTNIIGDGNTDVFQQTISGTGTIYSVSVH
jgi:hypothetical protein